MDPPDIIIMYCAKSDLFELIFGRFDPPSGRDDSPDLWGLLLSHRPSFGFSPSASEALFDVSLIAPIGDGAVLRRGDLHPIKPARRRHVIVDKHEPHSHAQSARLDAREMGPRGAVREACPSPS